MRRACRFLLPLLALAPALLAGCGPVKHAAYHDASTEGQYMAAGGLKYQIQLDRALNPALPEDAAYLQDLGPGIVPPGKGKEWFGVWMLATDDSSRPAMMAGDFDIKDTLGNVYTPVAVKPANILSYQPRLLRPHEDYPYVQTAIAQSGPRRGAMLLFQISTSAYQNRPLTFTIHPPDGGEPATVKLDL